MDGWIITWMFVTCRDTVGTVDKRSMKSTPPPVSGFFFFFFLGSGTKQERGLIHWLSSSGSSSSAGSSSYDFPLGMGVVRKTHFLRWFPICPTFTGFRGSDEASPPDRVEEEEADELHLPSTKV